MHCSLRVLASPLVGAARDAVLGVQEMSIAWDVPQCVSWGHSVQPVSGPFDPECLSKRF